jgi:collagenase-like PrtC family protease
MPADFKKETIDEFEKFNETYKNSRVIETYGNITVGDNFGSGRVLKQLPPVDFLGLQEYVEYSASRGIQFSYTLNTPYWQNREFTREGALKIKEFLKHLYDIGIRDITVSMPSFIEMVKLSGFDFSIKASAICHINTPNKALAYKKMGVDRIVVDESVHRDFAVLKEIVRLFEGKVEIIVNTMCHRNCIYRHFHYNETGGDSTGVCNEVGVNFFEHKCLLQRYDTISGLLKLGWVRPEDLNYYADIGIDYFKLQGRQHVAKGGHLKALQAYMQESYDGNLMDLLDMFNPRYSFQVYIDNKKLDGFLEAYVKNKHFCKNNCSRCNYCETYARKAIDYEKTAQIIALAKEFYKEYDQFKKLVDSLEEENPVKIGKKETAIDFDFNLS